MRREIMKSDWQHVQEKLGVKWELISDAILCSACDQRAELVQLLQDMYHLSREDAESEVNAFTDIYRNKMFN